MTAKPLPREIFIVAAKRTPFGAFGGKLKKHSAIQLGVIAAKAAMEAGNVDPESIEHVVFGNVGQTSADALYMARHIGLKSGVPIPTPGLTVNRLCGSGFQAVISGAHEILAGDAEIVLTGGTENMSQAPFAARDIRWGVKFGPKSPQLEDTLWSSLSDPHAGCAMGNTAENLAEKYGITREMADAYALRSQQAWGAAQAAGYFKAELTPIELKSRKGPEMFEVDEHPRPDTTLEKMAKLPSVFMKDGTVSAGNASGICDGAGALVIASAEAVKKHNLTPLARVVQWGVAGVDPKLMGIGPVPAIKASLDRSGLSLNDMDQVEINEAFAPQYLSCEKELELDRAKVNVNGGAIALGHPLAASGARIMGHLVHELARRKGKYAVGSACIGGGQGIAIVIENVS
ncbi:MAG: acetyl-CoA C-acetyltransferase [Nannocystaceae bacterium]|nr:acetyl-CoA C-acetyltransferase [Nannocystaceae bacterium]